MTDLARFRTSAKLLRLYGKDTFKVGGEGETCCSCHRDMELGEIGYGGGVDYWGEGEDWYCLRCAHDRLRPGRHDRLFYDAMCRGRRGTRGLKHHDRRVEKQWWRPNWQDRRYRNRRRP